MTFSRELRTLPSGAFGWVFYTPEKDSEESRAAFFEHHFMDTDDEEREPGLRAFLAEQGSSPFRVHIFHGYRGEIHVYLQSKARGQKRFAVCLLNEAAMAPGMAAMPFCENFSHRWAEDYTPESVVKALKDWVKGCFPGLNVAPEFEVVGRKRS